MNNRKTTTRLALYGLATVLLASCGLLDRPTQVVTKQTLVEPPTLLVPDELRRSCLIELPAPRQNEDLVAQRARLWSALVNCDKARAEGLELLERRAVSGDARPRTPAP